jgi:hypothetical protein
MSWVFSIVPNTDICTICIIYKLFKTKKMTEQEKKEFEAEWRSRLKLALWLIAMGVVFGLIITALCWVVI